MAAITGQVILKTEGVAEKMNLYRVPDVTTGDTMDLSADYDQIKIATQVVSGAISTAASPTISGTSLTFAATLSHDTVYVLVLGAGEF